MGQTTRKVFTTNGTFVAPAGVKFVTLIGSQNLLPLSNSAAQSAMLCNDGFVYAWGLNLAGDLGDGTVTVRSAPVAVVNSFNLEFIQIYNCSGGGESNFLGLTQYGEIYGWGNNFQCQLGVGDLTPRSSPVLVLGSQKWTKIFTQAFTGQSMFAINQAGQTYAWGSNLRGQLGIGSITRVSSPVLVLGGHTFTQIVAGNNSSSNEWTLGLDSAGAAWAWGQNTTGQLGIGNVTSQSSPILVLGGQVFTQLFIDSTSLNAYGLTAAGALYAWGQNLQGSLGVGDSIPRSSPVLVLGGHSFKQIVTWNESVLALDANGAAWAWGYNGAGQLGVGDVVSRSSPVLVLGGLTLAQINLGNDKGPETVAFGIDATGVAYAWGGNAAGDLGTNTVGGIATSSPVLISGGLKFAAIYPTKDAGNGYGSQFGVTLGGALYAWGLNANGQLGVGDVVDRSSPTLISLNKAVQLNSIQSSRKVSVTPGATYAIDFTQPMTLFGTTAVAPCLNQLIVEFDQ